MINYVWIGLIILAIGYGAYLDMSKVPTTKSYPATMLEQFEGGATPSPMGTAATPTGKEAPLGSKSGLVAYQFTEGRRAVVPTSIKVDQTEVVGENGKPEKISPDSLEMWILQDGSGNKLEARFRNAAGDLFVAPVSAGLGTAEQKDAWAKGKVSIAALVPLSENPTAKAALPLTLDQIIVVRQAEEGAAAGSFLIDNVGQSYAAKSKVADKVTAGNWMGVLNKSFTRWAEEAVTLAIGLIGVIMFWLGLMRIAEQAGLVQLIARAVRPVMVLLFPGIPPDGEAMGAIVMNVAANMLGLGNAATPLGLKAMEELQKVNEHKEYASNAQCMLLAINTSSVTLIAPTIMAYRASAGSQDVMKFWPVMIGATIASTIVAVIACKILEKLPMFRIPLPPQMRTADTTQGVQ